MLRKFTLLFSLFTLSSLSGAFNFEENNWHQAVIRLVVNKSLASIELADQIKKESAPKGNTILKKKFIIPFASMTAYMREIHADKPYIPASAIHVKTALATFGIWEDERGVQMCKLENSLLSDSDSACECLMPGAKLPFYAQLKLHVDDSGVRLFN